MASLHKHIGLFGVLIMLLNSCPKVQAQGVGTLARIHATRELVIATDPTYNPFEFTLPGGKIVGFDVDLGDEIGREIGAKVRWLPMEWSGILGALETHKCDAVMAGVTITDERKRANGFSRTYFLSGQSIVRRKGDARINAPSTLLNKTVAVIQETTGQKAVEKLGIPKDRIHRFDTQADGLMDVKNGKSDAAVGDLPAVKDMLKKSFPELEIVGDVFTKENVGVETRKADIDLIGAINAALDRIIADGRYARMYQKWIGDPFMVADIAALHAVSNVGTPIPPALVTLKRGSAASEEQAFENAAPAGSLSIRWGLLRSALPYLVIGARLTLWITLFTLVIGAPLGLIIALMRLIAPKPLPWIATIYVEVVRGTPLLMQIYVIYFVLPALHLNFSPFIAAVTALSLNAGAYISEIFRAGIQSIDLGQMEAARALGMSTSQGMRHIILPQTLRRVLPPLTNEAVALLKDSSLVSVVALSELMRVGKEFATNQGSPTTIYLGVAAIYLAMTLPLTWLVRRLEIWWQPVGRGGVI